MFQVQYSISSLSSVLASPSAYKMLQYIHHLIVNFVCQLFLAGQVAKSGAISLFILNTAGEKAVESGGREQNIDVMDCKTEPKN